MPNLTIKNLPDGIYACLWRSAELNGRSINDEVISCLESVLAPTQITTAEKLSRARAVRATINGRKLNHKLVADFKAVGRTLS
jgi:antitoxin FitA